MTSLWLAIQLLTIAPVPRNQPFDARLAGQSLAWYPVVGAAIGGVVGAVWLGLAWLGLPPLVVGAAALMVSLTVTGCLHLDGLLDACDGLLVEGSGERRLTVMRDSRIGSYAFAGGVCVVLIKVGALAALPSNLAMIILVTVLALSRCAMVAAVVIVPPGRDNGLAANLAAHAGRRHVALALGSAIGLAVLLLGAVGLAWAGLAAVTTWLSVRWMLTRVPGMTGDTLGALNEIVEATLLVVAVWPGWWSVT